MTIEEILKRLDEMAREAYGMCCKLPPGHQIKALGFTITAEDCEVVLKKEIWPPPVVGKPE